MKKLLLVLTATALFAACNNEADGDADRDTTTKVTPDGDTVTRVVDTDTMTRGEGDTTIRKKIDTDTIKKNDQ